ncbi:MAG: glycosyltransferase family 4 protein [bacterium]|nr:glycosyltransferase family 4 protein [bacterium]
MNIIVLTQHWYPDTFGGSEHVAAEQARRLAERGHQVTVLTHYEQGYLPPEETENIKNGRLRIVRYGRPEQFAKWGMSLTDLRVVPALVRKLNKTEKFDAAILHHPFPAFGFFLAKTKIPALYVFHASTAREAEVEGLRRKFSGAWKIFAPFFTRGFIAVTRFVEKSVLKKARRIVLFSDYSSRILQESYPQPKDKVVKIGIGINSVLFTPPSDKKTAKEKLGLNAERPLILTVRRLTARMGLRELLYAAEIVKRYFAKVNFLVAGEGPLKETLVNEIGQLNLQGTVSFVGKVPLNDLPLYYQAADAFILPTAAFEGLGMATLEALASGLPVIGTPIGATPEILNKLSPALITKSAKAEDLAQGVMDFLRYSEEEKESLSQKARQLAVNDYDWNKAVEELEAIIKNVNIKM